MAKLPPEKKAPLEVRVLPMEFLVLLTLLGPLAFRRALGSGVRSETYRREHPLRPKQNLLGGLRDDTDENLVECCAGLGTCLVH